MTGPVGHGSGLMTIIIIIIIIIIMRPAWLISLGLAWCQNEALIDGPCWAIIRLCCCEPVCDA